MSSDEEAKASASDHRVGYGRPPIATRFQPGKSGNPRGRPKGLKSLAKVFEEALARQVAINENGRPRKMRARDIIVTGLVGDAARRNGPAVKLLFSLIERYCGSDERDIDLVNVAADDRAIIEDYLASITPCSLEERRDPAAGRAPNPEERSRGEDGAGSE